MIRMYREDFGEDVSRNYCIQINFLEENDNARRGGPVRVCESLFQNIQIFKRIFS